MMGKVCSKGTESRCTQSAGTTVGTGRRAGDEMQTVVCEARYACGGPERANQSTVAKG
jgi:hypothetical protein